MAIASRFQPRNLAESRFNPFYGEMGGAPEGPAIRRATSPIGDSLAPEGAAVDPQIPGAQLDVQKGFLPEGTPTFNVHNPYYGDDYEAERWYSGSYGWRLPGGAHYASQGGSLNPYQKWGGTDLQYNIGNQYSDEPAFGTNITPYSDRWFHGSNLLPTSYESMIEDIETAPQGNPDVFATTTGVIPSWVGLMQPEVSSYHEYQPPKEMPLWGTPHTAYSRVNELSGPSFVDPYYEDLYGFS